MDRSVPGFLRGAWGWLLPILCALSLLPQHACGQSREYQVKAAFLFHFTQFVQWPASNSPDYLPFYIGVLGNNPFGDTLDEMIKGETVNGNKIAVKYSQNVDDLKNCRIVFINREERPRMNGILKKLNGKGILTVSDYDGFARSGGVINFYLESGKVHFEINPDAAQQDRLKISSQLMRLGRIVPAPPKKG